MIAFPKIPVTDSFPGSSRCKDSISRKYDRKKIDFLSAKIVIQFPFYYYFHPKGRIKKIIRLWKLWKIKNFSTARWAGERMVTHSLSSLPG